MINKIINLFWPPKYRIVYIAIGMMSNRYIAADIITAPTRKELRFFKTPAQYCFDVNRERLKKHYPLKDDGWTYTSKTYEIPTCPWWVEIIR